MLSFEFELTYPQTIPLKFGEIKVGLGRVREQHSAATTALFGMV